MRARLVQTVDRPWRNSAGRQAILKHAFEGKLVPQDPDDEPASALLARIKAERSGQVGKVKAKEEKPAQLKLANM